MKPIEIHIFTDEAQTALCKVACFNTKDLNFSTHIFYILFMKLIEIHIFTDEAQTALCKDPVLTAQ